MKVFENGTIPDITPENNPLTFAEAWQVLDDAFQSIYGFGLENFSLRSVTLFGRVYCYQIKNSARVWGKPATEKGFYDIWASQLLRGIAIARGPEYTHYASSAMPMYGECSGNKFGGGTTTYNGDGLTEIRTGVYAGKGTAFLRNPDFTIGELPTQPIGEGAEVYVPVYAVLSSLGIQ